MNINYKRLFNLNIGHNYFVDGCDRFARLTPTLETAQLLRNGNMLLKNLPHGITVLFRASDDEVTPLVQLDDNQTFVFTVTAQSMAGLLAVSDFDESETRKYQSGNILLYKNNPSSASTSPNNPEILTHMVIDSLRTNLFSYLFSISGNPPSVKIRVTNSEGTLVSIGKDLDGVPFPTTLSVNISPNNTFSQQINLQDKPKGKYLITVLDDSETTTLKTEEIYVDNNLVSENILGIVEVEYDSANSNLYADTEEYIIQFNAVNTFWKYYIINRSENIHLTTESLQLVDSGSVNGTPYSINQFERIYAAILLTADSSGTGGNSISLDYFDTGDSPAAKLSGETLTGGAPGVNANGTVTLINNTISGYTITIGGISFTEGSDFSNGTTIEDTASSLISAINGSGTLAVTASILHYDDLINNMQALVFGSVQEIPFYEKPKVNIELQQTSDDQVIIANLPNPSHSGNKKEHGNRLESEVYVFI